MVPQDCFDLAARVGGGPVSAEDKERLREAMEEDPSERRPFMAAALLALADSCGRAGLETEEDTLRRRAEEIQRRQERGTAEEPMAAPAIDGTTGTSAPGLVAMAHAGLIFIPGQESCPTHLDFLPMQIAQDARKLEDAGQLDEAEEKYKHAVAAAEPGPLASPDDDDVTLRLGDLAGFYERRGRLNEARVLLERAVAMKDRSGTFPGPHAVLRLQLVDVVLAEGDLAAAEAHLRRALELDESFREAPPSTLEKLAIVCARQGRREEAWTFSQRALDVPGNPAGISEGSSGPSWLEALLAHDAHERGDAQAAESHWREALAILQSHGQAESALAAQALKELGGARLRMGQHAEALPFFRRALAIQERRLGWTAAPTAGLALELGVCLNNVGQRGEAETLLRRALAWAEGQSYDHAGHALIAIHLCYVLEGQNRFEEAEQCARQALAQMRQADGPPDPSVEKNIEDTFRRLAVAQGRSVERG